LIAKFGVENICVHDDASSRICFKQQQVVVLENMRRHKPATTQAQTSNNAGTKSATPPRAQRQKRATTQAQTRKTRNVKNPQP
jgi:hypothetical protein